MNKFTFSNGDPNIIFDETELLEASEGDQSSSPSGSLAKFKAVAYTGVDMRPCGYWGRVVIDLEGIKARNKKVPIRAMHDSYQGVGHAEKVYIEDGVLKAEGVFSRETDAARDIISSAKNGFPWELSIGGVPKRYEDVEDGATFQANGKTFKGPALHVFEFELHEISFCDVAADGKTSADITAKHSDVVLDEDKEMKKTKIKDDVLEPVVEKIDAQEVQDETTEQSEPVVVEETLEAKCGEKDKKCQVADEEEEIDEEKKKKEDEEEEEVAEDDKPKAKAKIKASDNSFSFDFLENQMKNNNRIAAINSVSIAPEHEEIRAQALDEGWTFAQFNSAIKAEQHNDGYKKTMNVPKTIQTKTSDVIRKQSIEAAIVASTLGEEFAKNNYDETVLNMAYDARSRLRCFRDVISYGTESTFYRDDADDMGRIQAAFTTSGLDKIFKNVANKALLAGYETAGFVWKSFCSISSTSDFKPFYTYRSGGDYTYKKLTANTTTIENASFSEQEFSNQLETYGLKFQLSRQMIVNDDLNAFTMAPRRLGEGAGVTLNNKVFQVLLENGACQEDGLDFFSTSHKNYLAADASNNCELSFDNLGLATTMFETQTTNDGLPLNQEAKILLVPSSLKMIAWRLMNSTALNESTTPNVPQGMANPFAGRYEVVSTPYLQLTRSDFRNTSAKSWYLFGDPNRVSAIDVVFLNGIETPTIRQGDIGFDQLGVQYSGTFDFGVKTQDWRGAVFFDCGE